MHRARDGRWKRCFTVAATALAALLGEAAAQAEEGTLTGRVLDAQAQPTLGVTVVVCDQQTGIPLSHKTKSPFLAEQHYEHLWTSITDDQGIFTFSGLRPGTYRVIGQTWEDAAEPVTHPLAKKNGAILRLHGVADHITIPSPAATSVVLRPLGTASLKLVTDPECGNNSTLVMVSRAPLAADPVLAVSAWSGDFVPQMIGGHLMPLGKTTFHGLPAGELHIAAFSPDNRPGFGGLMVTTASGQTTSAAVRMLASWSNGHRTPPPRLAPLMKKLAAEDQDALMRTITRQHPDVAERFEAARSDMASALNVWAPFLNRKVTLEDGETVALKDFAAAMAYLEMERAHAARVERHRARVLDQLEIDEGISYEQAFTDLYETLGARYPCFELKHIDWQSVGARLLPRAKEVEDDDAFGLLCFELVAALEDSHAQLLPAAASLPPVPFPRWDAGFACLEDERGLPVVYFVKSGSSAESTGLTPGMTILEVNDQPAVEAVRETERALAKYVGYSSSRYLRYHAHRFFARQHDRGDAVQLVVSRPTGEKQVLALEANDAAGYLPRLPVPIPGIDDAANVSWKMLNDEIGYIYVRRIRNDLTPSLDRAVEALAGARGIILDVRGNSGGGFDSASAHRNFDLEDPAEPQRPRYGGPLAVLIDARCISAGEGWMSWFVARKRAELFGTTTAGASSRKTTYALTNGRFKVRYPVKAYRGYLDRPIERRGLEPDRHVGHTAQDIGNGTDKVLETAQQFLKDAAASPATQPTDS